MDKTAVIIFIILAVIIAGYLAYTQTGLLL